MDWRTLVTKFSEHIHGQEGLHSVKDLCNGLLHEFHLETHEEVMAYLRDYLSVSRSHLNFHRKWEKIPNRPNIADYDEKEIAKVDELIQLLSKES
jgi:hypothetical protein